MTATERHLKDICELLIDSKLGYADTATRADDPRLQELLASVGEGREGTIALLSAALEDHGVSPPRSGTFKGKLHRLWIAARDILSNTDDVNMLSECMRGESFLIGRVDEALKDAAVLPAMQVMLAAERAKLMNNVERIRSMGLSMSDA